MSAVLTPGKSPVQAQVRRRLPIGAEAQPGGGAHFRVWAPKSRSAAVEFDSGEAVPLQAEGDGYFSGFAPNAGPGILYKIRLGSGSFPDPASRFQPAGPHGPSEIVDSTSFRWTDHAWKGVAPDRRVIYEMHVGTFTPEGSWRAAMGELPELARLGITVIEMMPVADFAGGFGWGYDGVNMFAPTRLYGRPDDLRGFVDRAHSLGLAVILDVVYNHLGPDGCYLREFSDDYFSSIYKNEWGDPLNFDGQNSGPVREFFLSNALYWIEEFHLDGFRFDATQQMFDNSPRHILSEITAECRKAAGDRQLYMVGENEPQEVAKLACVQERGPSLDALWNDDYHHSAVVAVTGRNEAYYSDYLGSPQEFISALKHGFLYQGQLFVWQRQRRGTPAIGLSPLCFVTFIQNHDQIANSLRGWRLHQLTDPGRHRALTALLLLGPNTPMLFQGQEFAASSPFLYFADHKPDLAALVCNGRSEFLAQFPTINAPECAGLLAPPHAPSTFHRSKLDLSEREKHAAAYALHEDLLKLRREDPTFSRAHALKIDGAVLAPEAFAIRYLTEDKDDRLLLVNFGKDFCLRPLPEPLLAPPDQGMDWEVLWSSESPRYGGCGSAKVETAAGWRVLGHSAVVLKPVARTPEE